MRTRSTMSGRAPPMNRIARKPPDVMRLDGAAQRIDQLDVGPRADRQETTRAPCCLRASTWPARATRASAATAALSPIRGSASAPTARTAGASPTAAPGSRCEPLLQHRASAANAGLPSRAYTRTAGSVSSQRPHDEKRRRSVVALPTLQLGTAASAPLTARYADRRNQRQRVSRRHRLLHSRCTSEYGTMSTARSTRRVRDRTQQNDTGPRAPAQRPSSRARATPTDR